MSVDPRTPVIVGVGQSADRIDGPDYRGRSAVELAAAAAQAALDDCCATADVAQEIDIVAGVRQFEISHPRANAPLGRSNNYPRSVANRLSADPARAVLEVIGGQSPQHLVNEFAATIADGGSQVALLFGSDATSTERHFAKADIKPDFSETVEGSLEDRGYGLEGLFSAYTVAHGLVGAPAQYGLLENARRGRIGLSPAEYAHSMGELFAPFTRVAAKNPFAASPVERSADELITVTDQNRMITDPYPQLLVARDQVNQGAAVLLMSVEAARRLGVPEEKWVYLRGHADVREQDLLARPDLGRSPASVLAVREALAVAGVALDGIGTFDLYSCFPFPVFNICDGMDLATDDPRGLTLTGGLPYFGGAGNNYSMHAIAETVVAMRATPGQFGLVGANGGIATKYSVGVYSTTPREWTLDGSVQLQDEIASWPTVHWVETADGPATIETYTVRHDWPTTTGIIVGRLDSDGSRFLSTTVDADLVALLTESDPLGARIVVTSQENGNRATPA